jgi:tRNA pseudouridine38-40 synthase
VLLTVAYDGAGFSGFAEQHAQRTVAGELRAALRRFEPNIGVLRVASRTDAGVHARTQRVAFDTCHTMPLRAWVLGPKPYLPDAIVIRRACAVPAKYHPRFETTGKRYRYLLLCQPHGDPLLAGRAWRVGRVDDAALGRMRTELEAALGTHHFGGFASARDERERRERTITAVSVARTSDDPPLVAIDVEGDGFLHNMVRIMVGTVVDVGLGRRPAGTFARALQSRDRRDAGVTAPAAGLYLEEVNLRSEPGSCWPPDAS